MAFNISNLLATLDSSIAALDSASELIEVLQAINATNSTKGYGKTQRKYYTSVASLPAADSAMRGMVAVVSTAKVDSANGLYLCTGSAWTEIQDLDSEDTSYKFQGENYGYNSGGQGPPSSTDNYIQKYSFVSDANAVDVGDTSSANLNYASGQSSKTHGYISASTTIDKFSFSVDGNATDVGDLSVSRTQAAGHNSETEGYSSGGAAPSYSNVIDKFPFSSEGTATDVGDLTVARGSASGTSSLSHGYTSGGFAPPYSNVIDKFPFAADAGASGVGDLSVTRAFISGNDACSADNGYTSGGNNPGRLSSIDKFPFASDANAVNVGDLTQTVNGKSNSSSTTSGYRAGGQVATPVPAVNVIDKWPFSSDGTATAVGDLVEPSRYGAGQQY